MKIKAMLILLFVVLITNGSSCVNSGFLVPVDLPIQSSYAINPGPNTSFGGTATVLLTDQVGQAYRSGIVSARYYDVRVGLNGAYTGSVSGSCFINGFKLLDFSGQWSDFLTPQSLLGASTHITPQTTGTNELVRVLNSLATDPNAVITLSSVGAVSQGPVPPGLSISVTILAQADTQVQ